MDDCDEFSGEINTCHVKHGKAIGNYLALKILWSISFL